VKYHTSNAFAPVRDCASILGVYNCACIGLCDAFRILTGVRIGFGRICIDALKFAQAEWLDPGGDKAACRITPTSFFTLLLNNVAPSLPLCHCRRRRRGHCRDEGIIRFKSIGWYKGVSAQVVRQCCGDRAPATPILLNNGLAIPLILNCGAR
jgi:hypothetical protein